MPQTTAFQRGFTLIELMIVIVILSILIAALAPRLGDVRGHANDTKRMADVSSLSNGFELYYADYGEYPPNDTAGVPDCLVKQIDDPENNGIAVYSVIDSYYRDGMPKPANATEEIIYDAISCKGAYMYLALNAKGVANQAYAIVVNTEVPNNANMVVDPDPLVDPVITEYAADFTATSTTSTVKTEIDLLDAALVTTPDLLIVADQTDDSGKSTLNISTF